MDGEYPLFNGKRRNGVYRAWGGKVLTGLIQRIQKEAEPLVLSDENISGNMRKPERSVIKADNSIEKEIHEVPETASEHQGAAVDKQPRKNKIKEGHGSLLKGAITEALKNVQGKAKDLVAPTEEKASQVLNGKKRLWRSVKMTRNKRKLELFQHYH